LRCRSARAHIPGSLDECGRSTWPALPSVARNVVAHQTTLRPTVRFCPRRARCVPSFFFFKRTRHEPLPWRFPHPAPIGLVYVHRAETSLSVQPPRADRVRRRLRFRFRLPPNTTCFCTVQAPPPSCPSRSTPWSSASAVRPPDPPQVQHFLTAQGPSLWRFRRSSGSRTPTHRLSLSR
jgi:hypothetical protein